MISITERNVRVSTHRRVEEPAPGRGAPRLKGYFRWKYACGRVIAAVLLVPATPIMLLLVVLVRVGSPGPGIYRQVRVGRKGKHFTIYKIRTMRNNAEADCGATWATTDDPRLTRLGKFMRAVHLDEIPQLFNVVKGEMALVGPRPERPEFTTKLRDSIPGYDHRHIVKPGITGLAQINLPPDIDVNSVRRKLVLDLDYIREAGPLLDLRILGWTALRIVGLKGSVTSRIFRLYREVHLRTPETPVPDELFRPAALLTTIEPSRHLYRNGQGTPHEGATRDARPASVKPR